MKSEQEVKDMLARFDEVHEADELEDGSEGVRDALLWVLNHTGDSTVLDYLE